MWIFHSRFFSLIIFLLWSCCCEPSDAKHKLKKDELQSNVIACDKDAVIGINGSLYVWDKKYRNDLMPYATSEQPYCLDNTSRELIIRKCDPITGQWSPSANNIRCAMNQKQSNKFCPDDLIEISVFDKFVCLKLDDARFFNESFCYGSDTIFGEKSMETAEIQAILQYLSKERKIKRFWLPVRRASYKKYYNPLVVRLPGFRWGEVYEVEDVFGDNECLSAVIKEFDSQLSFQIQIVNCTEMMPMVCIYREDFVSYSGCPQGFGALAYKPNECYGIEWEAGLFPCDLRPLSFGEYISKRNSLQHIFYSIDLDEKQFFLIGNFSDDNKIKYNIEMNSKEELRVTPFVGRKHALSCENLTDLNRKMVEMILIFNPEFGALTLTIYNRNYIWRFTDEHNFGVKCYTNSDSDKMQWKAVKIKMFWQNILETKSLFKLKEGKYDGYYWCEAHTIFDFSIVRTNIIAVNKQKKGHTYALLMELPCSSKQLECYNPFSSKTWKYLNQNAKTILTENKKKQQKKFGDLEISQVRLMDIVASLNNNTLFQSLVHVSAYLKSSSVDRESSQSSEESDNEEIEFSMETTVRMKVLNLLSELISLFQSKQLQSVRSTLFCFPETFDMANKEKNVWQLSRYGQTSTTAKLCLVESGVPAKRLCKGDFLWGAFWDRADSFQIERKCSQPNQSDVITYELRDIEAKKLIKKTPTMAIKNVRYLLEKNLENIIPADFYYISCIMHSAMKSILKDQYSKSKNNKTFTEELARIYNFLMGANVSVIKLSATLNATNVLLEAFERLIDEEAVQMQTKNLLPYNADQERTISVGKLLRKTDGINILHYEDIGVEVKVASNFLIFFINPYVANVTGVALYRNKDGADFEKNKGVLDGYFKSEFYRFIMSNQSIDDLLYQDRLELATYIPQTLWNRLDEISRLGNFTSKDGDLPSFVIKIYANDVLFQKRENTKEFEKLVTSKIVSVSIPGHDKDLPEMMPLIFKISANNADSNNTEPSCSYWNYDTWKNDGLIFLGRSEVDSKVILCGCTHLTPFAYLVGDGYKLSVDSDILVHVETHQKVLDMITILGCSLSLFGTLGIFITAVTFQSWRQKASSKVLLQLASAVSLEMVLFCFVNTETNSLNLMYDDTLLSCIAIGALLHYSVLVQFSWMIIIGYLQFKRYVQVFGNTRPKRFFKKSSIIGWGAPLMPVALVLIFDKESYIPNPENVQGICYPSGVSLYLGVIFPITIIIIANFVIFSIIVYNILRGPDGTLRHTEKGLALSQLRLSILLFFLLGFTWIFGLLATLKVGIIFSYLFCLTATLQGFIIFIYFVILDPKTRRMWRGLFSRICGLKETCESSTSLKETIQTLR